MTNLQLAKLGKIIKMVSPAKEVNMDIYVHQVSKRRADEIMRCIPKIFHRSKKKEGSVVRWKEATKNNVYGFGRVSITVFYPNK